MNEYELSINYIVQSYYRLRDRKNDETLQFGKCGRNKSLHLFLSFLSFFHLYEFKNIPEKNIFLYGLTMSDEKNISFENSIDILIDFHQLNDKIKMFPFKFDKFTEIDNEIDLFFDKIEKNISDQTLDSTIEIVEIEIKECKIF